MASRAASGDSSGDEACGLLLGWRTGRGAAVSCLTRGANVAAAPRAERFELDPGHLVRFERLARARDQIVLGTWHSHPGPSDRLALSRDDAALAWDGAFLLLVVPGLEFEGFAAWRSEAGALRQVELRGRAALDDARPATTAKMPERLYPHSFTAYQ